MSFNTEFPAHFGRFNIEFEFFDKFFKDLSNKYTMHNYLYVQHIGDKRQHKHVHWLIDTEQELKPIKETFQMTSFKNKYNVKGTQQWYVKHSNDKKNALIYLWRGCKKHKLQYKTDYDIEWLDKISDEYIENVKEVKVSQHKGYLNILLSDDGFIDLLINHHQYSTIIKEMIIRLCGIARNYYNKYLSTRRLSEFTIWCMADVLEHRIIKQRVNAEIINEYKKKNDQLLVNNVMEMMCNTIDSKDLEYKINNLDFF